MPTSWYQAIPYILDQVKSEKPNSILDVGVGFGKYGMLLRDVLDVPYERYHKHQWATVIEGVEAFPDYRNPIHDHIYNKVYYGNILNLIKELPKYDVVLLIDVLEHFTKDEGIHLISELLKHTAKTLLVSTPAYPAAQDEYLGNIYERHLSRWSLVDLCDFDFSYKFLPVDNNGAHIFKLYPTEHQQNENWPDIFSEEPINSEKPLTIGYILPHKFLTGGMKMLLMQMKYLRNQGHRVIAAFRGNTGETVLPEWAETKVDKEILVPVNESFLKYVGDCDVIVPGFVDQLVELVPGTVPVLYWEQGYEWLFGDMGEGTDVTAVRNFLAHSYAQKFSLAAVSKFVSNLLYQRYNRRVPVISNGVDTNLFYPGEHAFKGTILLVGDPKLQFKGFNVAMAALQLAFNSGYRFNVKWVCQNEPQPNGISFPLECIVSPSQETLAHIYRTSDIFLFTSWYEGFGLPPLEAMASGVPVITTKCGGVDAYVRPGVNALVAEPGDYVTLARAIAQLLEDELLRSQLAYQGRKTALELNMPTMLKKFELHLQKLAAFHKTKNPPGKS